MGNIRSFFVTTNKGIPDLATLPSSVELSKQFYTSSLIIQIIFFMIFLCHFGLSIYRVVKKIKNPRFQDIPEEKEEEEDKDKDKNEEKQEGEDGDGEEGGDKDENLIYRFDDDEDGQSNKGDENKGAGDNSEDKFKSELAEDKQKKEEEPEENYDDYHDENEQAFIAFDDKMLFLTPFLIVFAVCNNAFVANVFTILLFVGLLLTYALFNLKGALGHIRIFSLLFMAFSILGFLPFFSSDHDLST